MAVKKVIVSDLSGLAIAEGSYAEVRITYNGRNGNGKDEATTVLDVNKDEIKDLIAAGRPSARRGRPRKS